MLGVVIAIIQPSAKDAPAGSAVFDGPHVVDARPASTSAPSVAPLAPQSPPVPGSPVQGQTPSAADVLRNTWPVNAAPLEISPAVKTWPDALSAPEQHAPEVAVTSEQTPNTPQPAAALNAQQTNISDNDTNNSGQDAANRTHQRRASHFAASRTLAPLSFAPNVYRSGRIVTGRTNDQQARSDSEDEASSQGVRPLFDFYGSPRQQQRVIDQDQNKGTLPARNDNWGSFFGHDNWNDGRRD